MTRGLLLQIKASSSKVVESEREINKLYKDLERLSTGDVARSALKDVFVDSRGSNGVEGDDKE